VGTHVGRKIGSMPSDSAPINLTHHFLIAMPGLQDELFGGSVVYLCEHSATRRARVGDQQAKRGDAEEPV
jgi:hypothetical protein